jgi:twitching motility protein PilT
MAELDKILKVLVREHGSDLHISSSYPPFLRIHGHMIKVKANPFSGEKCENLILETMPKEKIPVFRERLEMDWAYPLPGVGRFRVNAFVQQEGMAAVFRLIPEDVKSLADLGIPESLHAMADFPKGLVLVTGPTGSGKSTTLAALISHINKTRMEHIITIEDPIEFVHKGQNCLINQREVSRHTHSFANALKSALREDPDIILVGEMRDVETISLALTAAETGHLVFATLHTNNAAKSVDRIVDSFPANHQQQIRVMLSESLVGIVAQALLPRSDKDGRVAALEILLANNAVRNMIRENKTFQIPSVLQTSSRMGMMTFEQSVRGLLEKNIISQATAAGFLPSVSGSGT